MASFSELFGGGGGGFEIVQQDIFAASGTWTKSVDVVDTDIIVVDLWGGGGGGSSSTSAANTFRGAGGGGHNRLFLLSSILAATETVTVGAGGTGNPTSNGNGTSGGTSSFGNYGVAGGGLFAQNGSGGVGGGNGGFSNKGYRPLRGSYFGDKWRGGEFAIANGRETIDSHHGGGGGSEYNSQPGYSMWGGAGSRGPYTGTPGAAGISLYGGNSGLSAVNPSTPTAGEVPGGGGGCGQSIASANGGRGEARVYVIRGAVPDYEFVFEAV